jgi:hypothetical protein
MPDTLPLYDECKRCGGDEAAAPTSFGEHAWLICGACGEPVITWDLYKQQALGKAADQLRNSGKAKAGRRR